MGHPRYASKEIARRGKEIYEQDIRPRVETTDNIGKFLIVDIETGDYEMDTDEFAASRRAHARHPDGAFLACEWDTAPAALLDLLPLAQINSL